MTEPTDADRKHAAELIWGNRPQYQVEAVAKALAEERDVAYNAARWAVHARRFDHDHGEAQGPNSFYNGCLMAEFAVKRLAETGVSLGPIDLHTESTR